MSGLKGTNVAAGIVPFDSNDTFPTHHAEYGKGGWRSVSTVADLLKIPADRMEAGMAVRVVSESTNYFFKGGANVAANWVSEDDKMKEVVLSFQQPEKKEVINAIKVTGELPTSPVEGTYYIVLKGDGSDGDNTLYLAEAAEGSVTLNEVAPDKDVVYIVSEEVDGATTLKTYAWDGEEFVETTGRVIDKTIYVSDPTELIGIDVPDGIYNVIQTVLGIRIAPTSSVNTADKLQIIKIVKSITGLDLKSSKLLVDSMYNEGKTLDFYPAKITSADTKKLQLYGFEVSTYQTIDVYSLNVSAESVNSLTLTSRNGWAEVVGIGASARWEWHMYSYEGHYHGIEEIYMEDGVKTLAERLNEIEELAAAGL